MPFGARRESLFHIVFRRRSRPSNEAISMNIPSQHHIHCAHHRRVRHQTNRNVYNLSNSRVSRVLVAAVTLDSKIICTLMRCASVIASHQLKWPKRITKEPPMTTCTETSIWCNTSRPGVTTSEHRQPDENGYFVADTGHTNNMWQSD